MVATRNITPPEHLNSTGCEIRYSDRKGRGIFASRMIPAQTLIEISPVLLFKKDEYLAHGRYTVLDHYTFNWPDGRMALALGLGSLFNHSEKPNVIFSLDTNTESIRYQTSCKVECGEELFIFYGHSLWFKPAEGGSIEAKNEVFSTLNDEWEQLCLAGNLESTESSLEGKPNDIIPEGELPFTRLKIIDDTAEDSMELVPTTQAWVVDIPDARHIATMLKWIKQQGLDTPDLEHLKRVRKRDGITTLVLCRCDTDCSPPKLPQELALPIPYKTAIPVSSALTLVSQQLKSTLWPTNYTPPRRYELEEWSRGKVRWAYLAMKTAVEAATEAKALGELAIAAHLPLPFEEDDALLPVSFTSHDTRHSTSHPLRHAAQNIARSVAEYLASAPDPAISEPELSSAIRNGRNYLLTSQTLFMTHEPCIMCSMALLHSRVKEVFYLFPMEKTGGCGGITCLPRLQGVNHRFGIGRWKNLNDFPSLGSLHIGDDVDA